MKKELEIPSWANELMEKFRKNNPELQIRYNSYDTGDRSPNKEGTFTIDDINTEIGYGKSYSECLQKEAIMEYYLS